MIIVIGIEINTANKMPNSLSRRRIKRDCTII